MELKKINSKIKYNIIIAISYIVAALSVILLSVIFFNSEKVLDLRFSAAIKSGNYEKALSLSDAVGIIEPEQLKNYDLEIYNPQFLNHPNSDKKVLNLYHKSLIGLSDIIMRDAGFYLPKNSKLYFNDKEITDITTYYNNNDTYYFLGNTFYGNYKVRIENPLLVIHEENVHISMRYDDAFTLTRLKFLPEHEKAIREAAVPLANLFFSSAIDLIEYEDLDTSSIAQNMDDYNLSFDYFSLKEYFIREEGKDFVLRKNIRIEDIKFDDEIKVRRNSAASIDVTVDFSYNRTYHEPIYGTDEGALIKESKTFTVFLNYAKGKWRVHGFTPYSIDGEPPESPRYY